MNAPPIFIIGGGRSGTSLLRSMLNAHPNIYLLQEAAFYGWTRHLPFWWSSRRCLDHYLSSFSFAWTGVDPDAVRAALPEDWPRSDLALAFTEIMRRKAAQLGKSRFGEKNPVNSNMLARIYRDYPDAKVIEVVRDPRPAALSHARMPFSTPSLTALCVVGVARQALIAPHYERLLSVRLEDLVEHPHETLRKILEYVGEPWHDAVLHPNDPEDDGIPFPWLRVGSRLQRTSGSSSAWTHQLSPAWIRLLERSHSDVMERFGYEPAHLDKEPTRWERVRAVAQDLPLLFESIARGIWVGARLAMRPDAATAQRLLHSLNPRAWKRYPGYRVPDPPPQGSTARASGARRARESA